MTDKTKWEQFFDNHAPAYMDNVFTQNTLAEIEFIIDTLHLKPGSTILDMGCGTGRHAVELAKRGYEVTGVDLSSGMLAQARQAADDAGVSLRLIKADATQFSPDTTYDAAICLCEGAFNLLGAEENPIDHDHAILRNIHAALEPGNPFMLTTLLGFRHLKALFEGTIDTTQFDPIHMTETSVMEWQTDGGDMTSVTVRERSYTPSELRILLQCTGFEVEHLWGGTAGNWGKRPIDLFEMEMMVVCRRS